MAEVSYEPDEVGLKADHRGLRGRVFLSGKGGEVLSGAENIPTGLPDSMHLLQKLCIEEKKEKEEEQERKTWESTNFYSLVI